jgi:sugar lactone lactonase YvrE
MDFSVRVRGNLGMAGGRINAAAPLEGRSYLARSIEVLKEGGGFFEAPRWRNGSWYVSDFYRSGVFAIGPDGSEREVMRGHGQPSGLGWLADGSMLVVSMLDDRILRRYPDGTVAEHADLSSISLGHLNDMLVDPHGWAWVGCFGYSTRPERPVTSRLMRVDLDGSVVIAAEDLYFPNGLVMLPDGCTLVVGETTGNRYTAFTVSSNGTLTDRRVWAQFGPTPDPGHGYDPDLRSLVDWRARAALADPLPVVAADGCCLDRDGCIWAADIVNRRCIRVAEGGRILDEIHAPGELLYVACMLGGADGRTLLICAAPSFESSRQKVAMDAELHTVRVEAPRAGLP